MFFPYVLSAQQIDIFYKKLIKKKTNEYFLIKRTCENIQMLSLTTNRSRAKISNLHLNKNQLKVSDSVHITHL